MRSSRSSWTPCLAACIDHPTGIGWPRYVHVACVQRRRHMGGCGGAHADSLPAPVADCHGPCSGGQDAGAEPHRRSVGKRRVHLSECRYLGRERHFASRHYGDLRRQRMPTQERPAASCPYEHLTPHRVEHLGSAGTFLRGFRPCGGDGGAHIRSQGCPPRNAAHS
jgi:hypothetical protein